MPTPECSPSADQAAQSDGHSQVAPKPADETASRDGANPPGGSRLSLIGLGGSAGAITALQAFFSEVPVDSGMAFVVILHLAPERESALAEMLQQVTDMPVIPASDGVRVEPNRVYVIPPGRQLSAIDDHLGLSELGHERGRRVAVDMFFRTLADTYGSRAIAVVLSGADGDGATGIKRIKERGGLTIAQDPAEAEHSGMPRSAIETGMVDWVLKTADIPGRIAAYVANGRQLTLPPEEGPQLLVTPPTPPSDGETALRDILSFLHAQTGRNFSYYKRATILRRIARRMQVNAVGNLPAYLEFLRANPAEANALLRELLISVTNFFRDPDCFAALQSRLAAVFAGKKGADTVRAWVVACATGEEAYSLAILLDEFARTLPGPPAIQVFATDLAEDAIQTAREGLYPDTIAADVSEDRLQRYFLREHRGYRVRREIRETVLFAHHDLLKDSPFSRLDLLTCRNLLIYLNREAQVRAFDIFNFALRPDGLLFVGSSESVEDDGGSFHVLDKRHRIYSARAILRTGFPVPRGHSTLALTQFSPAAARGRPGPAVEPVLLPPAHPQKSDQSSVSSWSELHFQLVERLAPPSVLVDQEHQTVHLSATVGRFLQFGGGEPTRDVLRMVHPAMRIELRAALYRAAQPGAEPQVFQSHLNWEGGPAVVDVRVVSAADVAPRYFLILFEAQRETNREEPVAAPRSEPEPIAQQLEREIETLKANLRDLAEQSEASSEELKASNEELQAMNEEIRSAAEELETGREEMQSINEELTTVNHELKHKVEELGRSNSDLQNLISATSIATVFLDRELRITRYTPAAVTLFNFIPTDVGRPLSDLTRQRDYGPIQQDAARALSHLTPAERQLQIDSRWFLVRTLPYRTTDDRIGGVVLTLFDITERKLAEDALRAVGEELETRVAQRTAELSKANVLLRDEVAARMRAEEQRKTMARQLMTAQEQERARISRGLHDEIGQNLAALLLDLRAVEAGPGSATAPAKLSVMRDTVEKLTRQTHELAVELRPTALDDLGLAKAMANYLERWSGRTGINGAFNSAGFEHARLPPDIETTIYRIVCEALNNVAKHARATEVSVVVQWQSGQASAIVEDNGIGFDIEAAQSQKNLGIVGMKERADLVNGEVTIESMKGRGTTVFVRVPIETPPAENSDRPRT